MRQEGALSSEGWHSRLSRGALLHAGEDLARGHQWQRLEAMSAESEERVPQEKDEREAVGYSVMGAEDEDAMRLLTEQHSTKERSSIGSERFIYFFGNLPLPPGEGRCNHAERNALASDAAEVRDAVEGRVDAG
jgi:hypothetical protein